MHGFSLPPFEIKAYLWEDENLPEIFHHLTVAHILVIL